MKLWKIVLVSGVVLASGNALATGNHGTPPGSGNSNDGESITIYQDGYNNGADASQYVAKGSNTDVGQFGSLNYSKSFQSGDDSLIKVRQYGGSSNSSVANQFADNSTISVEQHGSNNWALTNQQ